METWMGTETQGCVTLRSETTAVIFLFTQTHHSVFCRWSGQAGEFHSSFSLSLPLELLLMVSGPVECICSSFRLCGPRRVSEGLKSGGYILGFSPMKQIRGSPAFVFIVMNDCFHSNTPHQSVTRSCGRPRPLQKYPGFVRTDWLEIWRGVVFWQHSVYKYESSILVRGGKKNKKKIRTTVWEECWNYSGNSVD